MRRLAFIIVVSAIVFWIISCATLPPYHSVADDAVSAVGEEVRLPTDAPAPGNEAGRSRDLVRRDLVTVLNGLARLEELLDDTDWPEETAKDIARWSGRVFVTRWMVLTTVLFTDYTRSRPDLSQKKRSEQIHEDVSEAAAALAGLCPLQKWFRANGMDIKKVIGPVELCKPIPLFGNR